MEGTNLLQRKISEFKQYLYSEERSAGTIEKYLREVRAFCAWLDGQSVTKALVAAWKAHLLEQHYAPETVNSKLVALHAFLRQHRRTRKRKSPAGRFHPAGHM